MIKVLIVDDDPNFREMISKKLSENNYQVSTAVSGYMGYTTALEEKPDMIIVDQMMETEDAGSVLCRKIKRDPLTNHAKLVLLNSHKDENSSQIADMEMEKPISIPEIMDLIKDLLPIERKVAA